MTTECTKCGSDKVIPLAGMLDQGQHSDGTLKAVVGYTNPDAWIFKGAIVARLRATICGECGYTELAVEDPQKAYEDYLRLQDREVK